MLTTPQGWVCIGASAAYFGAALFFWLTESPPPLGWSRDKTVTLFGLWPALLFLYFIKDNLPDFRHSWKAAGWLAFVASLPLLLLGWRVIGTA